MRILRFRTSDDWSKQHTLEFKQDEEAEYRLILQLIPCKKYTIGDISLNGVSKTWKELIAEPATTVYLKFKDAFEAATWINKRVNDPLAQERLMAQLIKDNYTIYV